MGVLRLTISDRLIFIIYFNNGILKFINIYPKDNKEISKILSELGGEQNYQWGKIEYNNDIKSGSESVVVTYN